MIRVPQFGKSVVLLVVGEWGVVRGIGVDDWEIVCVAECFYSSFEISVAAIIAAFWASESA